MTHGPGRGGWHTVIGVYPNGQVSVPFGSYSGQNSGIKIEALCTEEFRSAADALFGLSGTEKQAKTAPGWLTTAKVDALKHFCDHVAHAYSTSRSEILASGATVV